MSKINEALRKSAQEREKQKSSKHTKKALGKGLAALIGTKEARAYKTPVPVLASSSETQQDQGGIQYLNVDSIISGKHQPREDFDEQMLKDLIGSIKEKGVLQPILVRKSGAGFEIIAGERRVRASQALSLKKIPAIIKEVENKDALIISLIENIQRQELNAIEEAHAFQQLIDNFSFSQDEVAKALGKDKATVSNILRLLKLPKNIQQHIRKGELSAGHAKVLLGVEDAKKQNKLCLIAISKSLSVRELENLINTIIKDRKRKTASSKTADPYVLNCERQIQLALGTKVRIMAQRKRGKIVIDYYSPEDLERILKILKK